jgi:hypothetical protein
MPNPSTTGKLRLKRTGTSLLECIADGTSDDFTEIHNLDWKGSDLQYVRVGANEGGQKQPIDIRLLVDLQIQAQSWLDPPSSGRSTNWKLLWMALVVILAAALWGAIGLSRSGRP